MSGDLYGARMNDQDALMWHIERDPLLRSTMVGVMVLDRPPDPERFEQSLENLVRAMPRFRQRAEPDVLTIAPPRWEPDPWFDLDFHFVRVTAPAPGTRRDLMDLAAKVAMGSFDPARPLWRLVSVDGLEMGRSALVLKIHHSVTDAVGFFRVLEHLVQMWPDDQISPAAEAPIGDRRTTPWRVAAAIGYRARGLAGLVASLAPRARSAVSAFVASPAQAVSGTARQLGSLARIFRPALSPRSEVMRGRSLNTRLDTLTFPLDELRSAAKAAGGKLNDAFLAGLSGGFARYHALHGSAPVDLRVNMPINFRAGEGDATEGGNYFIPARLLLPITSSDPMGRIRTAGDIVRAFRSEAGLAKFSTVVAALDVVPALARPLFGLMLKSVDLNASNVPGPPFRLFCAGAEIEEMYPAPPLAGAAVSVSLLSYAGTVHLTVNTDTAAVADADCLVACLKDSFDELLAIAPASILEEA